MCDYSLHHVASRPAKVGDKLITTHFENSLTGGFAAVEERNVAVCLLPGTELVFHDKVAYERVFKLFGRARLNQGVARFRQVDKDNPHTHHDALEFADGRSPKTVGTVVMFERGFEVQQVDHGRNDPCNPAVDGGDGPCRPTPL